MVDTIDIFNRPTYHANLETLDCQICVAAELSEPADKFKVLRSGMSVVLSP